ncbi:tRNA (adenosine(37)-N6)-dimethylallyltransferase MiaA [Falsirhodobacter halotolerans]|uniref:tRNA (adenosine(37)-N6)-dimethylallyltransferase MiaA n=1 Tax=Falsirhodobacter halotolerans TaxID=1146892 RepID=UPI001FD44442|nr:tRNA (adenosine(37)-N6)-dimethylallyltransferase MiaA [Falsirhodobacter halotolerans]MCJ8139652.1 tRNA (adenosine(37)-N6)-dimethylallyltransferase MiaA [Falsirhodobacter halotolerans]
MADSGHSGIIAGLDPTQPVLIAGPTASGKSALAARIVAEQGGVIVNADALQVYANWRILTARPTEPEEAALPHALYGHVGRDQTYSTGHWLRDVAALDAGLRPVIVGGTGLYFMALTEGLADIPATPPDVRALGDGLSLSQLINALDPRTAAHIDLNNRARVQRAWEVLTATGRPLRDWQDDTGPPLYPRAAVAAFVLRPEPEWLNARIDRRFDQMMADGALDEARREEPTFNPTRPSSRAIGAPELIAALRGDILLSDAVARAKLASRQYAKRQRTWFRSRMRDWTEVTLP